MSGAVNKRVTSNANQILQGAGKLTVDGIDVGGFAGGVSVTYSQSESYVESDWSMGEVDSEITKVGFEISTELEELTLEHMAIALGIHTSSVLSGTSSKVLSIQPEASMREVQLVFEGMSGTNRNKIRTFTVPRAVRIGSSKTTLNRGVKTTVPVTFKALMSSGAFCTVVDATI